MFIEYLPAWMFLALTILLMAGFPVTFTLMGTALCFGMIGFGWDFFNLLPLRIWGVMTNVTLLAVPLFVFMGVMLERSGLAEELLDTMAMMFGRLRGGLAISVVVVGALLGASTGIVGATVVTMGLLAVPTMLKRGYQEELATGAVSASGTLGQIIPPSIVLVLIGDIVGVSVGDLFMGAILPGMVLVFLYILYIVLVSVIFPKIAPPIPNEELDALAPRRIFRWVVVALFIFLGAVIFGLYILLTGFQGSLAKVIEISAVCLVMLSLVHNMISIRKMVLYGILAAFILLNVLGLHRGEFASIPIITGVSAFYVVLFGLTGLLFKHRFVSEIIQSSLFKRVIWALFPPLFLMVAVLGSIFAGVASPTEAAAVGAVGSTALTILNKKFNMAILQDVMRATMQLTCMVFIILVGAAAFGLVFRGLGGDGLVREFLGGISENHGKWFVLAIAMGLIFVIGFFLDFIEITFIHVPVLAPIMIEFGFDPVWLCILIAVNLQTSFMTPPFGFSLFYLKAVTPPEINTGHIYRGIIPFVVFQLIGLLIVVFFPILVTWLPKVVFGN